MEAKKLVRKMSIFGLLKEPVIRGFVCGAIIESIFMAAIVLSGRYIKIVDKTITYVPLWEGPNYLIDIFYIMVLAIAAIIAFGFLAALIYKEGQ
jgi:hypothetical protein